MADIDLHPPGSEHLRRPQRHPFSTSTFFKVNSKKRKVLEPFKCIEGFLDPYKCLSCCSKTPLLAQLKTHSLTKIPINRQKSDTVCYICESCHFETYSRLILMKHIYTSRCKVTDKTSVLMLMKLVDKSGEKKIKLYCSEGVPPRTLHHVQRPALPPPDAPTLIPCHLCEFKTKDRNYLKTHILRKHTPPEAITWHQCELCLYVGKFKSDLNRHVIKQHTPRVKRVEIRCKFCRSSFKTEETLETHVSRRHTNEVVKWYRCDECPHKTRYSEHFKRHKREQHAAEEEQNLLLCEHCGYKAKQKIHLKLHVIQRHTADKDIEWYKCEECEYKAKLKASLKDHILRKHAPSDIKYFECAKCEYKTFKRYLLKTHEMPWRIKVK
ncbi:zinc finger Y-chromosomal protein 2-like [Tribolium madens]|uniref:zinc finger Y-chromosomal protein 2-like n=1 Tax=Tribolium madens TaxID=41895 RepID=UPI001CF72D7C|nr:zinc finger Y-chromosomal protein 2-like [Tribolium madens]